MARLEQDEREMAYRIYLTDALYLDGMGKRPNKRFMEILNPEPEIDGDEVAEAVIRNAGLKCKE